MWILWILFQKIGNTILCTFFYSNPLPTQPHLFAVLLITFHPLKGNFYTCVCSGVPGWPQQAEGAGGVWCRLLRSRLQRQNRATRGRIHWTGNQRILLEGGGEGRPRVTRTTFKGRCRQRHDTDGQTGLPFRVGGGGVKVWGVGVRKVQLFRGQR